MAADERRLAAILAADVVGYSRLMAADEGGTLARLRALRREVVDPQMAAHGGRVFKTTGDGLLAEFPSAVQALRCAIAVQAALRGAMKDEGALQLRIGLHQGDVVVEGDDLLGDGVNVAARLEPLAEPGGICISGRIREDAAGKIVLDVEDMGEPALKNMDVKVRVFRVRLEVLAAPAPAMADKPSIAVLPFQNLSEDPAQEYFSDGLTEDILTALARFHQLAVIARTSTFVYKGRSVSIAEVGRDLGVRYVLEGSIRKAGNRIRVTAQLIEAATSTHLWADRYDRPMSDIFALQDEITERIVTTLVGNIERRIVEQARRRPPESLDAYELWLHARELLNKSNREAFEAAEALLERALALDPTYALAHAGIAYVQYVRVTWRWEADRREEYLQKGFVSARRALEFDPALPLAHSWIGLLHLRAGNHDEALAAMQRAIAFNPGEAENHAWFANALSFAGRSEEALHALEQAIRLNPLYPPLWDFYTGRAMVHLGRNDEAVTSLAACLQRAPGFHHAQRYLAAALAHLGRIEAARKALRLGLVAGQFTSIGEIRRLDAYREGVEFARLIDGLRQAGMPE